MNSMIGDFPVPGNRCWANFCGSHGLPPGLADRTPLVVLEWFQFCGKFRGEKGRIWELNRVQIDSGYSFFLDGEEFHESGLLSPQVGKAERDAQCKFLRLGAG